jgi:hypothetical protein
MTNIFIIGNGFDLAHELPTSYKDFLRWLIISGIEKTFMQSLNSDSFGQPIYTFEDEVFKIELISTNRHLINDLKKDESLKMAVNLLNSKFFIIKNTFIENLYKNAFNNWVDIETFYHENLIECYEVFKKHLQTKELLVSNVNELNKSLEYLKRQLITYLKTININKPIILEIVTKIETILNSQTSNVDPKVCIFLNFNYTSLADKYIKALNVVNKESYNFHIHGELENIDNPIIFGYGDETNPYFEKIRDLDKNQLIEHYKTYNYSKTNIYRTFTSLLTNDYNVNILGHSCGLSDRVLLKEIFENDNCKNINILYHKKSDNENNHFQLVQNISRHFDIRNMAKMRNKIVPIGVDFCRPLIG